MLFYEGLHGAVTTEQVNIARYPDLLIGVVPVINLEWIQKLWRDKHVRGYSTEAVTDTILRRMPDYVHYIVPQFAHTHVNFQRVPVVDTSNPFIARDIPSADESMCVIRFANPEGHRLPLPAEHDQRLVDEPRQHHRRARRQDGTGDAADLHALHLAHDGAAQACPGGAVMASANLADRPRARPRGHAHRTDADGQRLRALAMDAVQQANSGHPGAPMGMAEMAVALWHRPSAPQPGQPAWPDRDRFVLSNGHASMLLYALLHLSGYDLPMDELQRFRQLHSRTPGHPEVGLTPGVETTTGPLGQGLANAVGMALAERAAGRRLQPPGHTVVDHRTYVFLGDGCLMEGISHEACSLAGTLGPEQADRAVRRQRHQHRRRREGWFGDDTPGAFEAYGWNVIGPVDGHDVRRRGARPSRPGAAQTPAASRR
jgi:transketolase N-terminal domain/subunit